MMKFTTTYLVNFAAIAASTIPGVDGRSSGHGHVHEHIMQCGRKCESTYDCASDKGNWNK